MTATITTLRKRPVRLSDLDEPTPQHREGPSPEFIAITRNAALAQEALADERPRFTPTIKRAGDVEIVSEALLRRMGR